MIIFNKLFDNVNNYLFFLLFFVDWSQHCTSNNERTKAKYSIEEIEKLNNILKELKERFRYIINKRSDLIMILKKHLRVLFLIQNLGRNNKREDNRNHERS